MAKPLTDLTRDKVVWRWGDVETNSFAALKVVMAIAPILRFPDFDKQFVVMIDASDVAAGGILEQDFGSGLQPIAFASRKLSATRNSLLRLRTRDALHRLGFGTVKTLFTESISHNYSDISCATQAPPEPDLQVNNKVWRSISILQGYNVEIRHIPGKRNPADSLSRQLISDALVRKDSVKDANPDYVMRLRVDDKATDEDIQNALHKFI